MNGPYFLGIDIGTQGARVVLLDVKGNVRAAVEESFPLSEHSREEQSPQQWWNACLRSLKKLTNDVKDTLMLSEIKAVSVTSTSGTVIPLDDHNVPIHNALMYSDKRSAEEGNLCREVAAKFNHGGYTGFNASSGLSKMVWFTGHFPGKAKKIARWVHATDFITGKLSGCWGITDYTNALKSGYDLVKGSWPAYLSEQLPLKKEWLPTVVPSGSPIATIEPSLAAELGLADTTQIVAGMTDGCTSQIASGAVKLGDWNTTIGTTLVIKGVTREAIRDPEDRLYNHRHPDGFWMPGGASNTGADWITGEFSEHLEQLNTEAEKLIPGGHLSYPLRQQGERFPFIAPYAIGFEPEGLTEVERFTANMEGVAYLERYAFEMIERLSGDRVNAVFTAGGGSNSDVWLTIRSNVLNLRIYKMRHVTGAVGAAILAASRTHFASVIAATEALTQIEKEIHPTKTLTEAYEKSYREFLKKLEEKSYIGPSLH